MLMKDMVAVLEGRSDRAQEGSEAYDESLSDDGLALLSEDQSFRDSLGVPDHGQRPQLGCCWEGRQEKICWQGFGGSTEP